MRLLHPANHPQMKLPPNWSWQSLNDCYVRESGMESKPFLSKEFAWANWSKHGFTEQDLTQVLRYLRKQVKKGERKPASMLFRNLIEYPENFEQELSLSKEALLQKPPPDARSRVLAQAGMATEKKTEARPVGSIIGSCKAFEEFKEQMRKEGLL